VRFRREIIFSGMPLAPCSLSLLAIAFVLGGFELFAHERA
jgi:hypothetical protein